MTEPLFPEFDAAIRDGFDPKRFFELARRIGHGRALGIDYCASGQDWVELRLPWREDLVGIPDRGLLASGAIVSLIDTASGGAVWVKLGKFLSIATLDLRIDYLRPSLRGEAVHARCECVKLTRKVAFVHGIAHSGDPDRPVAHSAGTFILSA